MLTDDLRDSLLAYLDDRLSPDDRSAFEQQLRGNAELQQALAAARQWQDAASAWEPIPVPAWSRLRGITTGIAPVRTGVLTWLSLGASMAAILLVLFQAQFTISDNGFALRFGSDTGAVKPEQLERRMVELERRRNDVLNERLEILEKKSLANNRQLLAAALQYNRLERQDDMRSLAASWSLARSTDQMRVEDLRDSQFDDRLAIRQLFTRLPELQPQPDPDTPY
ncbi:MAG: hypothetical protein AAGC91_03285 [Pseudomonadota bacterium]